MNDNHHTDFKEFPLVVLSPQIEGTRCNGVGSNFD